MIATITNKCMNDWNLTFYFLILPSNYSVHTYKTKNMARFLTIEFWALLIKKVETCSFYLTPKSMQSFCFPPKKVELEFSRCVKYVPTTYILCWPLYRGQKSVEVEVMWHVWAHQVVIIQMGTELIALTKFKILMKAT